MPRYKLTIEYDGTPYQGWQWQDHGPSVQGALQEALFKLSQNEITLYAAGRTDSGVHAIGQVAHFDMDKDLSSDKVRDALNYHLGDHPISVLEAARAHADFHARFDAQSREYLYRILPRRPRLALDINRVWRVPYTLDPDAMHAAAQVLVGEHDFTTFRDTQCQAQSPVKTLDTISVRAVSDEVHISVVARSFLHRQVRSIVGSLNEVGRGHWQIKDMSRALKACDRTACGPVAPPDGLYLVRVDYPA